MMMVMQVMVVWLVVVRSWFEWWSEWLRWVVGVLPSIFNKHMMLKSHKVKNDITLELKYFKNT